MRNKIFISFILFSLSIITVFAQDEFPNPKPNQTYPVGTELKAVCKFADASYKESTWTNFQKWDDSLRGYGGINTVFDPVVDPKPAQQSLLRPENIEWW